MMKTALAAGALAALTALPASAATFQCAFPGQAERDWISPATVIALDAASGGVSVANIITQGTTGGPVPGVLERENGRVWAFGWEVRIDSSQAGSQSGGTRLLYRAVVQKSDGSVTVTMRPPRTQQVFSARGRCAVR